MQKIKKKWPDRGHDAACRIRKLVNLTQSQKKSILIPLEFFNRKVMVAILIDNNVLNLSCAAF